jgi:hypothetical protein
MIMLDVCAEEPSLMFIFYVVCMVIKIDLLFIVSVANDYNCHNLVLVDDHVLTLCCAQAHCLYVLLCTMRTPVVCGSAKVFLAFSFFIFTISFDIGVEEVLHICSNFTPLSRHHE